MRMSDPDSGLFAGQLAALKGDMSVAEFARKCGLGDSLMRKYLDGAEPGLDKVRAIWSATRCSLTWLVTGAGRMYESGIQESRKDYVTNATFDETVSIPHYDIAASAGLGAELNDTEIAKRNYFRRDWWTRHIGLPSDECFSMDLRGDSMYPRLTEDHTPICHRVKGDALTDGGIYVFRLDGEVFVKQLEKIPGHGIVAKSENPRYTPWEIGDGTGFGEFTVIAKIIRKQLIELP
jgi:phage repressor protein C with HTH and peptisase S24 domain